MSAMTKMYLWSLMAYAQNEVYGTILVFWKEEISRFHIGNFDNGNSIGGKVQFSMYIHVVCSINFPE